MLEIIAIIFLCKGNYKREKEKGQSGGAAIAYTLGLWIGMEFFGAIIAALLSFEFWGIYFFALLFAVIGGFISYAISKRGETLAGHIEPHNLITPCTVRIIRDASEDMRSLNFYFYLNGEQLDALENDSMLITKTSKSHNTVGVRIGEEQFMKDTYQFLASANGVIDIHCSGGKFQPALTKVIGEGPEKEW